MPRNVCQLINRIFTVFDIHVKRCFFCLTSLSFCQMDPIFPKLFTAKYVTYENIHYVCRRTSIYRSCRHNCVANVDHYNLLEFLVLLFSYTSRQRNFLIFQLNRNALCTHTTESKWRTLMAHTHTPHNYLCMTWNAWHWFWHFSAIRFLVFWIELNI